MDFLKNWFSNFISLIGMILFVLCLFGVMPLVVMSALGWVISWQVGTLCVIGLLLDIAFLMTVFND